MPINGKHIEQKSPCAFIVWMDGWNGMGWDGALNAIGNQRADVIYSEMQSSELVQSPDTA